MLKKILGFFANAGVKSNDSAARARASRLGNLITPSAVFNCLLFGIIFWIFGDNGLVRPLIFSGLLWSASIILNILGFPTLGRTSTLISGNFIVFWFACQFRGESLLQLFLFSLAVMPFVYFSWEERGWYALTLLSMTLLVVGEKYSYDFFETGPRQYDMTIVRIVSSLAPLFQIIAAFFYYLRQSMKFEAESIDNLRKLELEHRKQLQVQKMSSLGEMAAGVAHEINNPLAIILAKLELIRQSLNGKIPAGDPSFATIGRVEETANRIAKIVRSLRSFSRDVSHDPTEAVTIDKVIEDTLELCQQRFKDAGIELKVRIEPGLVVNGRPVELSQVLLNLLNNAFDAIRGQKNSWIEIRVAQIQNERKEVQIIVEDSGPGIPEPIADKIFQPFFTTKDIGKGTGLGLSVSKGIIESQGGKLTLIGGTGHTTLEILLPT